MINRSNYTENPTELKKIKLKGEGIIFRIKENHFKGFDYFLFW